MKIKKSFWYCFLLTIGLVLQTGYEQCKRFTVGGGPGTPKIREVFILVGQSNMVGDSAPPFVANQNIKIIGPTFPGETPKGPYGPGYAFALDRLHRESTGEVVLVRCALGGSSISQWENGTGYLGNLSNQCIDSVLKSDYKDQVTVILFWQGETDAFYSGNHFPWAQHFVGVVNKFRSALHSPTLPVVFCRLEANPGKSAIPDAPYYDNVVHEQELFSTLYAYRVDLSDLSLVQGWHGSQEQYAEVGRRMELTYDFRTDK